MEEPQLAFTRMKYLFSRDGSPVVKLDSIKPLKEHELVKSV
jgi:hypothetical protein